MNGGYLKCKKKRKKILSFFKEQISEGLGEGREEGGGRREEGGEEGGREN